MRNAIFSFCSVCTLLIGAMAGSFIVLTNGCKKQDPEITQAEKTYAVTYRLYSLHTPYLFTHCENNGGTPYQAGGYDTIKTNEYTVTLQVNENALDFYQYVVGVSTYPSDSLFISAQYDGKYVATGYGHNNGGTFSQSIQLSSAK